MRFAYLDESKDENRFFVYSTVIVDGETWATAFEKVKEFRRKLRLDHGIYIAEELHAWKFAAGKGQISDRVLDKSRRAAIFREVLEFIASAGEFNVISSCNRVEQYAFERLMNRLNNAMKEHNERMLLICDQGEEREITRRMRRLRVHNPIPSRMGTWADGAATKNIPLDRFVEDPVFKDSKASYFIQLADFCAYALMRMERPIESRTALGYDTAYELLRPCCYPKTNPSDPRKMGIIR